VLDLGRLHDEVGDLDQPGVRVATGDDDVLRAGTADEGVDDVVDVESGRVRLGLASALAEVMGARAYRLEELSADSLTRAVKAA
jgi:magnesium chelatase subunit D